MCEHCENGHPMGGDIANVDLPSVCEAQLAESLRDAIRAVGYGERQDVLADVDRYSDDIDRYIDELVRRIRKGKAA